MAEEHEREAGWCVQVLPGPMTFDEVLGLGNRERNAGDSFLSKMDFQDLCLFVIVLSHEDVFPNLVDVGSGNFSVYGEKGKYRCLCD